MQQSNINSATINVRCVITVCVCLCCSSSWAEIDRLFGAEAQAADQEEEESRRQAAAAAARGQSTQSEWDGEGRRTVYTMKSKQIQAISCDCTNNCLQAKAQNFVQYKQIHMYHACATILTPPRCPFLYNLAI